MADEDIKLAKNSALIISVIVIIIYFVPFIL